MGELATEAVKAKEPQIHETEVLAYRHGVPQIKGALAAGFEPFSANDSGIFFRRGRSSSIT